MDAGPKPAHYTTSAIDLLTGLMTALVGRNDLDTSQVEDVILGCVTPIAEQGGNIARIAPLYADWHVDVPGIQVNPLLRIRSVGCQRRGDACAGRVGISSWPVASSRCRGSKWDLTAARG